MTQQELEKEFEYVRRTFFPRWDRRGRWKVTLSSDADLVGGDGQCDPETKTIRVQSFPANDRLKGLLIHEVAHAAACLGHGKRWSQRMTKAAEKAKTIGKAELAELLTFDISIPTYHRTAGEIYGMIADAALDRSGPTYSEVIEFVRYQMGFTKKEFLRRYRRTRKVFDDAKSKP